MSEIKLTKPESILFKNIEMDLKKFVLSFSKLLWNKGGDAWTEVLDSLSLSNNSREEQAWLLFFSALTASLTELLDDYPELLPPNPTPRNDEINETFVNCVIQQFETQEIILTSDFFKNPNEFLDNPAWKTLITDWLKEIGFQDEHFRHAFVSRLKSQFTLALHEEWSRRAEQYTAIAEYLNSPFLPAAKRERELARYRAFLQKQVDERVFNETFGLKEIYIRLRAYYETQPETSRYDNEREIQKHVVDLHKEMNEWIDSPNPDTRLRIICGGPGSGKSSFAKMLAAEQASKNHLPVLFVPLHRFKLKDYLLESISSFVENHPYLQGANPIENQENNAVLLIFDGLDELSMQGAKAERTAEEFIVNVQTILRDNPRWKAIITGRDMTIQTHKALLNQSKMLWHMLSYFLDNRGKKAYTDPKNLLTDDQRDEWWEKFGQLKGLPYTSLPQELATEHLQPITCEPLLNYLVALTYQAKRIQFDDNTNLNQIYADLLKSVYERQYEQKHSSIQQLTQAEFEQILEEIALTVWHGNGRTASVNTLVTQCNEAGLGELLKCFQDNAEQGGVMRLMTAFYFREFGKDESGDKTFEFTHKSFGEYLTARRIVVGLNDMCEEVARNKQRAGRGWTLEEAFVKWLKLCGAEVIDEHLYEFIDFEIQLISKHQGETLLSYQKLMFDLLTMAVKEQTPVKKLNLETFKDDLKYSIHAESALLILHGLCANHICANHTQKVLEQQDEQFKSLFKKWFQRNQHGTLLHRACQYLDLSGIDLEWVDLTSSNFSGANLSGANLSGANLSEANLRDAKLFGAKLFGANLSEANLREANLSGANLNRADLREADLREASLREASLSGTNLREANLRGANLYGADLYGADLRGANLYGADLYGADLYGADLYGADLTDAKLPDNILAVAILLDEQREEIQRRFNQNRTRLT